MKLIGILLAIPAVLAFCVLASMFATMLWYCFDDALAALVGVPVLGTLNWYHVWPATLFISTLFKSSNTNNCKNTD